MPADFVPCQDPLSCPSHYRTKCHHPIGDGECDLPKFALVHATEAAVREPATKDPRPMPVPPPATAFLDLMRAHFSSTECAGCSSLLNLDLRPYLVTATFHSNAEERAHDDSTCAFSMVSTIVCSAHCASVVLQEGLGTGCSITVQLYRPRSIASEG